MSSDSQLLSPTHRLRCIRRSTYMYPYRINACIPGDPSMRTCMCTQVETEGRKFVLIYYPRKIPVVIIRAPYAGMDAKYNRHR